YKRDRHAVTLKLSAKNRHAKAAQKRCARLSRVYCCYDFLIVTMFRFKNLESIQPFYRLFKWYRQKDFGKNQ
ncbi:hypothetical protein, partial [Acinetobacter baumannii]|uniref:hypothetical protein n=1 Tax=Acinetobacter baumannii TaxID=470 RepID=UPI0005B32B2B